MCQRRCGTAKRIEFWSIPNAPRTTYLRILHHVARLATRDSRCSTFLSPVAVRCALNSFSAVRLPENISPGWVWPLDSFELWEDENLVSFAARLFIFIPGVGCDKSMSIYKRRESRCLIAPQVWDMKHEW
jgi:hypothetical protein